jgi:hypothetical protein
MINVSGLKDPQDGVVEIPNRHRGRGELLDVPQSPVFFLYWLQRKRKISIEILKTNGANGNK